MVVCNRIAQIEKILTKCKHFHNIFHKYFRNQRLLVVTFNKTTRNQHNNNNILYKILIILIVVYLHITQFENFNLM